MQVPIKLMLDYAREKNFMLSRFLITNLESIEALTNAAIKTDSPFLYDIYFPLMERSCLGCVEELARRFIDNTELPTALFADHIDSVDSCITAIDRGYSGVMIDLSRLSLTENIKGSKEVVDYAHKKGVFVEGGVGIITRGPSEEVVETDPEEAREYIAKTGVDCLAISIGVHSGFYKGEPSINYDLIKKLSNTGVHLCLHGASGLSKDVMQRCISFGMHFTGYGTDPLYRYFSKIDEIRNKEGEHFVDPSRIIIPARDEMQKEIQEKIYYIKSNGRAREIMNLYKNLGNVKMDDSNQWQAAGILTKNFQDPNNSPGPTILMSGKIDMEKLINEVTTEVLKRISKSQR